MKPFHILFAIILVLPLVSGSIYDGVGEGLTSLFTGDIPSGNSIELNSKLFVLTATGTKASLTGDGVSLIVNEDDCAIETTYGFCVDAIQIDSTTGKREATVRIYEVFPFFDLNQTLRRDEEDVDEPLFAGEEVTVDVILENEGQNTGEDIRMEIVYPSLFTVSDVTSPCVKQLNTVVYEGEMDPTETESCTYKITPQGIADYEQGVLITSYVGDEDYEQTVDGLDIEVQDFLDVELIFNDTTPDVHEIISLNGTLRNRYDGLASITSLEVQLPPFLQVHSLPPNAGLLEGNRISFDGRDLGPQANYSFSVDLFPTSSGATRPELLGTYVVGGSERSIVLQGSVVTVEEPEEIELTFEGETTIDSLQDTLYGVWVENPNTFLSFKNLSLQIFSNLTFSSGSSLTELGAKKKRKVLGLSFIAPEISSSTSYPLNFNLSYVDEFGTHGSEILAKSVKVNALEGLTITHTLDPKSPRRGNWTEVVVNVKNERTEELQNVRVQTTAEIFDFVGRSHIILDFDADENIDVYSNHLIIPSNTALTSGRLITTARFTSRGRDYVYAKNHSFTIDDAVQVNNSDIIEDKLTVTRSLSPSPSQLGETYLVTYTLTNDDTVNLENVLITLPQSEMWDIVGNTSLLVDVISPGSTITLTDVSAVRPKFVRTLRLHEDKVQYFRKGTLIANITKNASYSIESKVVNVGTVVQRFVPTLNSEGDVPFTTTLRNIGSIPLSYLFEDGSYSTTGSIGAKETLNLSYSVPYEDGLWNRPSARLSYEHNGKSYTAFSNKTEFLVEEARAAPVEIPQESVTPESSEETAQEDVDEPSAEVVVEENISEPPSELQEEDKPFFLVRWASAIIDGVVGWFR